MNDFQNTMHRLATIADDLERAGYVDDADQITALMEEVTASALSNTREAQWGESDLWKGIGNGLGKVSDAVMDASTLPARTLYQGGKYIADQVGNAQNAVGDALGERWQNSSNEGMDANANLGGMMGQLRSQPGINKAKAQAGAASSAAARAQSSANAASAQAGAAGQTSFNSTQQQLAQRYLSWAKGKGSAGVLNRIYDHAMKHQSPQFVNQLMSYLKSQGVS